MNQINITINVAEGGVVNIHNSNPIPYRTVQDKEGLIHSFYSKEDLEQYQEEINSKNR